MVTPRAKGALLVNLKCKRMSSHCCWIICDDPCSVLSLGLSGANDSWLTVACKSVCAYAGPTRVSDSLTESCPAPGNVGKE